MSILLSGGHTDVKFIMLEMQQSQVRKVSVNGSATLYDVQVSCKSRAHTFFPLLNKHAVIFDMKYYYWFDARAPNFVSSKWSFNSFP